MSVKKPRTQLAFALLISLPLTVLASGWSYEGQNAPEHWAEIDPSGASNECSKGQAQSPIDVNLNVLKHQAENANGLSINYRRSALQLVNNGHSIQANLQDANTLSFQGTRYKLMQIHFHTPSEHQYNDKNFPMEMHWVNRAEDGRLVVIGAMIKEGKTNTELAKLWPAMPKKSGQPVELSAEAAPDIAAILPAKSKHLLYTGSLTTPPCTEGVQWILFEQPIEMSKQQIRAFQQLFPDNHRPIKPLNERAVTED